MKKFSICWFTPQIVLRVGTAPRGSQEPETPSKLPTGMAEEAVLSPTPAASLA